MKCFLVSMVVAALLGLSPCAQSITESFNWGSATNCPSGATRPAQTVGSGVNGHIEIQCVGGAYQVRWHSTNGTIGHVGRCAYDWGENEGRYCTNSKGEITFVGWINTEGHHSHGMQPSDPENGKVHDDTTHGRFTNVFEFDVYNFNVASNKLLVIKYTVPIGTNGIEGTNFTCVRTNYDGVPPSNHSDLVTSTISANSPADGDNNARSYSWAHFVGLAQPGVVRLTVRGYPFVMTVNAGEPPQSVAARLSNMVNASPLAAQGVEAFVHPPTPDTPVQFNLLDVHPDERSFDVQGQGPSGLQVFPSRAPGFSAMPPPEGIPTLSEWGLIILAALLLALGTRAIMQRSRLASAGGS